MCGRMNISDHEGIQWLLEQLGLTLHQDKFTPKFNVSPTAALWGVSVVRHAITLEPMQWGYIPPWAKEGVFKKPLFNVRSETIWEKPSFKNLIRRYRAIVPANGFYEWSRKGKEKDAHYISLGNQPAMALASIVQTHSDGYLQCCLITTQATDQMQQIHHRQPVIIAPDKVEEWLTNDDRDFLNDCMAPPDNQHFDIKNVSGYVNNSRHEGPECLNER